MQLAVISTRSSQTQEQAIGQEIGGHGNTSKHRMYASASGQSAAVGASQKFLDASARQNPRVELERRKPSTSLGPAASPVVAVLCLRGAHRCASPFGLNAPMPVLRAERLLTSSPTSKPCVLNLNGSLHRGRRRRGAVAEMEAAVARAVKTAVDRGNSRPQDKESRVAIGEPDLHQDKLLLAEVETACGRRCVFCGVPA